MIVMVRSCTFSTLLCLVSHLAAQTPPKAANVEVPQRIAKIAACLPPPVIVKGETLTCSTLAARMAELHIPGVSVAVVHNGVIEWAQGFGVLRLGGSPVSSETLFQAGSISKPIAALAALHLVQEGKLTLDAGVNTRLTSWKLPSNPALPGATVTLRELLTHTAGITVHGFPGYATDASVPSLVQVLDGMPPANTAPIRVNAVPGSHWDYSGGGYIVMQQLVTGVAQEPFPKLLHDDVLSPIGMTHSTYDQPLPAALQSVAAVPYTAKGEPLPGGAHTYPEMAAAGLWTTPSDLARYIIEVQRSLNKQANHVLSSDLTAQMLTPGQGRWGLGLQTGGSAAAPYFTHGGVNDGFESVLMAYKDKGEGAVIMTNAQGGSRLANEVLRSIAVVYGWPDNLPVERTPVKVEPVTLARYVGTYQATPTFRVEYTLEGNQLFAQATGQQKFPIFPESDSKFFMTVVDAEIDFHTDEKGKVDYLVLHQNGQDYKEMKK